MLTRARRAPAEEFDFAGAADGALSDALHEERQAEKTLREYTLDVPEPGVGALRFEDFPFQEEWYSEEVANAGEVVLAKSAQIGASAWAVRIGIRQSDQFGDTGLYVFPTQDHVNEFSDERVDPAIEASPYLQRRIPRKYVKTKKLKRIGRGFLHFRGSNSNAGAQSIAAQFVIFDEYDLLDQTNLVQIERRISGATQIGKKPKTVRLGYPFLVNTGIDREWKSTDQRVWHVCCRGCGLEQPIAWEENFRWTMPGVVDDAGEPKVMRPGMDAFEDPKELEDVWRVCASCEASLEDSAPGAGDGALRVGRWIAQRPGARAIGFHAWRGMVPVTDLRALVIASRGTKEGERLAFSVLDLGKPYTTGQAALTDEDLALAAELGLPRALAAYDGPNPVTMGVDVGDAKGIHVQIDEQLPEEVRGVPNPRRTLWMGTVGSFDELAQMVDLFRVSVVGIDYNPERRLARTLRSTFPGRVVMVEFATAYDSQPLRLDVDDNGVPLRALVNRTDMVDGMMDAIRQRRSRPLQRGAWPLKWAAQMKSLHRVAKLDTKGRPFYAYEETGSDGFDYAMAAGYALVATELWRAFGAAREQIAAQHGRRMEDEEIGFRRMRLDGPGGDYEPGFGGE